MTHTSVNRARLDGVQACRRADSTLSSRADAPTRHCSGVQTRGVGGGQRTWTVRGLLAAGA